MRLKLFENFDKSELDELFLNAKDCFSDFVDLTDDENVYDIIKDEEGIILFFKLETNYRTNSFDTFFKFKSSEFKIINDIFNKKNRKV